MQTLHNIQLLGY